MKLRQFIPVAVLFALVSLGGIAIAQEPNFADSNDTNSLRDAMKADQKTVSVSSDERRDQMTAAEIRQARALYRSQQRIARLERNLWLGYEPLRPNWNAIPMTSSRYSPRRVVYVPAFYYAR